MTMVMTQRRFSAKEFFKMVEAGILNKYDRVELVDGEIIEMVGATKRRFSVKDFYLMDEAGMFCENDRVELVDGEIIEMAPIGSYHGFSVDSLNHIFVRAVPEGVRVRVQGAVQMDESAMFQPDLAILRPREDNYVESNPTPEDALLIIEVSDSTEAYDRNVKIPKYAQADVPEVWHVNLPHSVIDRYADPDPAAGRYRSVMRHSHGQRIVPTQLRDITVEVSDILRRPE